MKIGILGTGGVGGYFGAKLATAGHQVKFLARGQHLANIQKNGLIVKSVKGDMHLNPADASQNLQDFADCQLIIFTCKSWQVEPLSKELKPYLNKNALLLPLQNGVLAAEEICRHFPKENILNGLCVIFSKITAAGEITHMGLEPIIKFGELDKTRSERSLDIEKMFLQADIQATLSNDIAVDLWLKFVVICLGVYGATMNATYGELRELPETRAILQETLQEIYTIGKAKNINLPDDTVERSMKAVDSYPADVRSSLARDILEGKSSEIEYQTGCVVKFGKELGIKTPYNQAAYAAVKMMMKKNNL